MRLYPGSIANFYREHIVGFKVHICGWRGILHSRDLRLQPPKKNNILNILNRIDTLEQKIAILLKFLSAE